MPASMARCWQAGARLVLADTNGDRRADYVCSHSGTGIVQVDLAGAPDNVFDGRFERNAMLDFCPETTGLLVPIDYSGAGREGLICQVPAAPPTLPLGSNTVRLQF